MSVRRHFTAVTSALYLYQKTIQAQGWRERICGLRHNTSVRIIYVKHLMSQYRELELTTFQSVVILF